MSQQPPNNIVIVGQLGRPHGVKGLLRMQVFGSETVNLLQSATWLLKKKNNDWHPIKALSVTPKPGYLLVKLEGVEDRDAAQSLTNKDVAVYASELPHLNEGEYYWNELIGLTVINKAGIHLGQIIDLMETGANDVLVLKDEKGVERLIPYLPGDYVLTVDLKNKQMTVDWDENF